MQLNFRNSSLQAPRSVHRSPHHSSHPSTAYTAAGPHLQLRLQALDAGGERLGFVLGAVALCARHPPLHLHHLEVGIVLYLL